MLFCVYLWLQAIIAACSEEPARKTKSPVHASESLQRSTGSVPVSGDRAADETSRRHKSPQRSDLREAADAPSSKHHERNAVDQMGNSAPQSMMPSSLPGSSDAEPVKRPTDASLQSPLSEGHAQSGESYVQMLGPPPPPPLISSSRSPSKHHSRSGLSLIHI